MEGDDIGMSGDKLVETDTAQMQLASTAGEFTVCMTGGRSLGSRWGR